jgi:hypothetical protein
MCGDKKDMGTPDLGKQRKLGILFQSYDVQTSKRQQLHMNSGGKIGCSHFVECVIHGVCCLGTK